MNKIFFLSALLFVLIFLPHSVYGAAPPSKGPLIPLINRLNDFCNVNKGLLKDNGLKYAVRVYETMGKYRVIVWLNPYDGGYMQQHDLSLSPEESKQRNPIRSTGGGGILGRTRTVKAGIVACKDVGLL